MADPVFSLSQRAVRTTAQPIGELMAQAVQTPGLISFGAGLVDYGTLPCPQAAALAARILAGGQPEGPRALQYGTTEGHAELRAALLEHMAQLDGLTPEELGATPDDVIVSNGSQQLLFILTEILVDPGDIVITGWPSYFVYTGALKTFGAEVRCVDIDDHGMKPEALEGTLAAIDAAGQLDRVKIVYAMTDHQNPTGVTIAPERRPALLEIVERYSREHRILLIEDGAYRELTYDGVVHPSIKQHDPDNRFVALTQTFSKVFSPGLRLGYGIVPRDLVPHVLHQKGSHDFGSSNLSQFIVLNAMRDGVYHEHVGVLRAHYRAKAQALVGALTERLGGTGATWTEPSGGLYVWLTLPDGVDTGPDGWLYRAALAEGVSYVPGAYCYAADATRTAPRNSMRLAFGTATLEQIPEGVARLARAIEMVQPQNA